LELVVVDEALGHLLDAAIDGEIVMPRRDDWICPHHRAVVVHLVVMDQHAARRVDDAHALISVHARLGAQVAIQDQRLFQQLLHPLHTVQRLNQRRILVEE